MYLSSHKTKQLIDRSVPIEKRAYISEIVSAVLDGGLMTLYLPTPGTAQYISYLLFVVSRS